VTSPLARALVAGAVVLAGGAAARAEDAPQPPAAVHLEAGSVAREALVAVGRDLVVDGRAEADVVALEGSATVSGSVEGDVVVLGGAVRLGPTAVVRGDVFALGGAIAAAPGAEVDGHTVAYPTFSRAWLTLLEGPSLGLGALSPIVVGAKLALAAGWLLLAILLIASDGRAVAATAQEIAASPGRSFAAGLVGLSAMVLSGLFLTAILPGLASVPLLVLVALAALLFKLWGMVAVFLAVGDALARRVARRRLLSLHAALAGLLLLALLKFVPWAGLWCWTVASLVGVGASLRTKFGRREPWFATKEDAFAAAR